ncbi:MAG: TetR family transcriptional regulator [Actinomycetota bacterium]|nr:TetR family transcriptional regulator [Actinomycetota bacterium]
MQIVRELTVDHGWDRVRMAEVAALAGVSRPTLYKEFGDKRGLGEALVLDETERFLVGITEVLDGSTDNVAGAITAAVHYTLDEAESNPVLRAILTSARGDHDLLPALTTRSAPIVKTAGEALTGWLAGRLPDLDPDDIAAGVDALVRLTVSHLVLPAAGHEQTANRLAQVALRYLRVDTAPALR